MTLFAAAFAQATPAPALAIAPAGWTIDYGRNSCTLARRAGGAGAPIVAFNARLGREPGELVILGGENGLDPRLAGELALRLGAGPSIPVRARREQRSQRPVVRLLPVPDDLLARLAVAEELRVVHGDDSLLVLVAPGARGAVDALIRCNDDLMQTWGVDVPARRALHREPRLIDLDFATRIQPHGDASLVFIVQVTGEGRPLDCRVPVSSGNGSMDGAFCRLVRRSARFEPALDAEDRPVAAQYVSRIHWLADAE